ncbi:hypothetical protein C8R47DRAFT_512486 [Mycena vitilis]|nr:hypothetical protein C8R47DRAFT_512486 [Mycena vitilis]
MSTTYSWSMEQNRQRSMGFSYSHNGLLIFGAVIRSRKGRVTSPTEYSCGSAQSSPAPWNVEGALALFTRRNGGGMAKLHHHPNELPQPLARHSTRIDTQLPGSPWTSLFALAAHVHRSYKIGTHQLLCGVDSAHPGGQVFRLQPVASRRGNVALFWADPCHLAISSGTTASHQDVAPLVSQSLKADLSRPGSVITVISPHQVIDTCQMARRSQRVMDILRRQNRRLHRTSRRALL